MYVTLRTREDRPAFVRHGAVTNKYDQRVLPMVKVNDRQTIPPSITTPDELSQACD